MKLRYTLLTLCVICMCGFMLTACEGPPDQEIMDAEDAIKDAVAAGADADSPKLLDQARTLLQEAKMYSEQGNNKNARNKAVTAKIKAEKAGKNASNLARAQSNEVYETPATTTDDEETNKPDGSTN